MNPFDKLFRRMMETFHEHQWKKLLASWTLQDKDEKKARLQAVMALSVELAKIREVSIFSTAFAEAVIEEIIEGDWARAEQWAQDFTFEHQGPEIAAKYGPIWESFRVLLLAHCAEARRRQAGAPGGDN